MYQIAMYVLAAIKAGSFTYNIVYLHLKFKAEL